MGEAIPRYMQDEMLTQFSPYEPYDNHEVCGLQVRAPLRPHLSA